MTSVQFPNAAISHTPRLFLILWGQTKTDSTRQSRKAEFTGWLQILAQPPKTHPAFIRRVAHGVIHMNTPLILASGSEIRAQLLRNAAIPIKVVPARVDEDMIRSSMIADGAKPRDVADALAEIKARKISEKHPGALVLGCDQVLDHQGTILSKPQTSIEARAQLHALQGGRHMLYSAAVLVENGKPVWRHIGQVRMLMRAASVSYIDAYVQRNWDSIRHSVGAYKLEEEGAQLFTRVDGDYFSVLGLPLLELIAYLTVRGDLQQ